MERPTEEHFGPTPTQTQFDMENRVEDSSYYTLKRMNQLHHEIVRRIVIGQKDQEIADAVGCTRPTVKYTRESPVVKRKLEIMMGARDESAINIRKRIQQISPLALQTLEEIMISEKESAAVRTKVAQDLLDRAGFDAVKKTLDMSKFGQEKIEEIKQRARQNGMIVREEIEEANVVEEDDE